MQTNLCAQWGHVRYAEHVHTTQLHTAQHFWCANRLSFVYVANCNPHTKGPTHSRQTQLYSTLENLTVARTKPSSAGARKKNNTQLYIFLLYSTERPEDALMRPETCRSNYILITILIHQLLFIHKIIFSSTCFEPQVLIFRRIQLYKCSIWYCHSLWEFLVACRYTA